MSMAGTVIIVNETSWCETCNQPFAPTSDYHIACEARVKNSGPFPPYLPKFAETNPHVFCSEECEQDACDQVQVGRLEFNRLVQEGEIEVDTPDDRPESAL
jgi:hypothetical protein